MFKIKSLITPFALVFFFNFSCIRGTDNAEVIRYQVIHNESHSALLLDIKGVYESEDSIVPNKSIFDDFFESRTNSVDYLKLKDQLIRIIENNESVELFVTCPNYMTEIVDFIESEEKRLNANNILYQNLKYKSIIISTHSKSYGKETHVTLNCEINIKIHNNTDLDLHALSFSDNNSEFNIKPTIVQLEKEKTTYNTLQ